MLIDGHNAIWRASISFGPKKTEPLPKEEDGEFKLAGDPAPPLDPVKEANKERDTMVFNFFRSLRLLVENGAPDRCFFVLEGHPQFRYDLFADYKANRLIKQAANKASQDRFSAARNEILRILQHLPITIVRAANYEADDVIGSLCDNMREEDLTVISNDSDYIQLLQRGYPHLTVYNPIKKVAMEAPEYPYVAWKCLAGDKSDNIPSLMKPKKVQEAMANPEAFKRWMEVEENRANFSVHRQLIEFHPVPEEEIEMQEGSKDYQKLKAEFTILDFQSIINDQAWAKYTQTFDVIRF